MRSRMAVLCTNMPEAQPDFCVAYHVFVLMLVVHLTEHICGAADSHEGTSEPRHHSEFL